MEEKKSINWMRSALVSAHGLKNEVCYNIQILISCLRNYLIGTRNALYSVFVITAYRVASP